MPVHPLYPPAYVLEVMNKAKQKAAKKVPPPKIEDNPYFPYPFPWMEPPYPPFRYFGEDNTKDAPHFFNKDLTEVDLTSYLQPIAEIPGNSKA